MRRFLSAAGLLLCGATVAIGQSGGQPESVPMSQPGGWDAGQSCWLGSLSFSSGATIRAGDSIKLCGGAGWEQASGDASGCIREGKFHSTGDRQNVANNDATDVVCAADGKWVETAK